MSEKQTYPLFNFQKIATMSSACFKLLGFGFPILLAASVSRGQSVIDAAKYSQTSIFATARSTGFGGALGSVGGDFSSLSINPAGIGVYRTSEFMVTPGLRFNGTKTDYSGASFNDNNVRFGFNNLGFVFTDAASDKNYDKAEWKSTSFGIGLNRTADFSRAYNYTGQTNNTTGSFYFEQDAIAQTLNSPGAYPAQYTPGDLAFQSYLLNDNFYSMVPFWKGIDQNKTIQEKGGITELVLSGGGNYRDKLMVGATLGINFLNHRISSSFQEQTTVIDPKDSFDNFTYNENVKVNGTGVNLKLGAIYKFNDYFRAGLAVHTPTVFTLTEIYNKDLTVNTEEYYGVNNQVAPENQYEYTIITPFKAVASATAILGKNGFVSIDYEFVNHRSTRFNFQDQPILQKDYNNTIKNLFTSASNVRAGIELKFDQFMVRGGFGYFGSPYKNKLYQGDRTNISAGIGYRFGQTFVDFGVVNSSFQSSEKPYYIENWPGYTEAPTATTKNSYTTGVLTIGWKL
jgi:hypothetical protein